MSSLHEGSGRRRALCAVLLLLLIYLLLFASGFTVQRLLTQRPEVRDRPLGVFWEAWDVLEAGFYGELPPARQRTYGAIRGLLALLGDPYTVFLEPQPAEVEQDRLEGTYGGIGVDLWRDGEGQVVLSPYDDSPAEIAGVQTGDLLLEVDAQPVLTDTLDEVRVRLRGEVGTVVTLTLSRPPAPPFDLPVERSQIEVPSVSHRLLDQDPTVGYLHITSFTGRTQDEAAEAVETLLAKGATRMVLDLRENYGGLIQPAVEVTSLFVDGDVVLYEIRSGGEKSTLRASSGGVASELPLAILVDSSTASAAEIVAGAIQSRGRGILVGEPTFGKGSVQLIYTLSDGSSLHVTAATWLLPNGEPIGPDGLRPDLPVAKTAGLQDTQLDRALLYLQRGE